MPNWEETTLVDPKLADWVIFPPDLAEIPQEELESNVGESDIWNTLLSLQQWRPMDGWIDQC